MRKLLLSLFSLGLISVAQPATACPNILIRGAGYRAPSSVRVPPNEFMASDGLSVTIQEINIYGPTYWGFTVSRFASNVSVSISGTRGPNDGLLNVQGTEYLLVGDGTIQLQPGTSFIVSAITHGFDPSGKPQHGPNLGPIDVTATGNCP